jgi:hypothetical protein
MKNEDEFVLLSPLHKKPEEKLTNNKENYQFVKIP